MRRILLEITPIEIDLLVVEFDDKEDSTDKVY